MLKIYGASDDLVEIEGHVREEFNVIDRPCRVRVGTANDGGVDVVMLYGKSGMWGASIELLDGDGELDNCAPIPWPIEVRKGLRGIEASYSVVVEIACPDGTPVAEIDAPTDD